MPHFRVRALDIISPVATPKTSASKRSICTQIRFLFGIRTQIRLPMEICIFDTIRNNTTILFNRSIHLIPTVMLYLGVLVNLSSLAVFTTHIQTCIHYANHHDILQKIYDHFSQNFYRVSSIGYFIMTPIC